MTTGERAGDYRPYGACGGASHTDGMRHGLGWIGLTATLLYAGRRYYRNWGATKEDCTISLPGDELVGEPAVQTTDAVWIDAPASAVWPWLVQIGQDRGGFYSYQTVEDLFGLNVHNADRIHPEWQQLHRGDTVRLMPKGWMGLREGLVTSVVDVVAGQSIVLRATPPTYPWDTVWTFHLMPHWEDRSRLLVRRRIGMRHPGEILGVELAGPASALLTVGMLRGIKRRAEAEYGRRPAYPGPSDGGSSSHTTDQVG